MKKLFVILFGILSVFITSCTPDDGTFDTPTNTLKTEVKLFSKSKGFSGNLLDESTISLEQNKVNTADAYFYIRIDSRIPDAESYDGSLYFPQTAWGKSVFTTNKGSIDLDYVYKNANGKNNITKYVYSTDGSATKQAIVTEPSLQDLVDANKNYIYDISKLNQENLKIIWYIVKYEENIWHVDGVLTDKSTNSVLEIPNISIKEDEILDDEVIKPEETTVDGEVEVDIHQQVHKDYKGIKTSVHVRAATNVEVFIPVALVDKDDFDIRTYESYYKEYKDPVKLTITHTEDGMLLNITGINQELLDELEDDGITFEIFSYIKETEDDNEVWANLKESTVSVSPKTTIRGQITSAIYSDKKEF